MDQYLGSHVSLDCGDVLGTYQGKVTQIDNVMQTITIISPFRNGAQCKVDNITINARDIKDLKILQPTALIPDILNRHVHKSEESIISGATNLALHPASDGKTPQPAPVMGTLNGASAVSKQTTPNKQSKKNRQSPTKNMARSSPTKAITIQKKGQNHGYDKGQHNGYHQESNGVSNGHLSTVNNSNHKRYSPNGYRNQNRRTPNYMNSSEDDIEYDSRGSDSRKLTPRKHPNRVHRSLSSSAPQDSYLHDSEAEFDIQKNLALFDKNAVMREIEGHGHKAPPNKTEEKYRCDENVLDSGPVVYRRIAVPSDEDIDAHYVTDSDLVVPCVSSSLREKIISSAEQTGLTMSKQTEMLGRSATEMILQLIGGGHRLGPKNAHQRPCVVLLCGEHRQGAAGLNTARQLACHNVDVQIHFIETARTALNRCVSDELALLKMFKIKTISALKDLPNSAVDMIVNCLDTNDSGNRSAQYNDIVKWCNTNRARVLTIDPPTYKAAIKTHCSLGVGLPLKLHESWGKLYLCDVGIPPCVYKNLDITYQSPFAHKFCIPLHIKDYVG